MVFRRFGCLAAMPFFVAVISVSAACASGGSQSDDQLKGPVVVPEQNNALPPGVSTIAHMPATAKDVGVIAEDANVKVVRDAHAGDIQIASNCPRHWNVSGSVIRQAGFAHPKRGASMRADALGSRAVVNGKVYLLPSGGIRGPLSMNQNGVTLNGQKVEPLAGVDLPGVCQGDDEVVITVPDSYTGNLVIGAGGNSAVAIPTWQGGDLKVTMIDASKMVAGTLADLNKAAIDIHGAGKAEIADLSADIFVANVSGSGRIDVRKGLAKMSNATINGDGQIKIKGRFDHLKQQVVGSGTIEVN